MKARYIGGYSIKLFSKFITKIVNPGDVLDIPDHVWETELKNCSSWKSAEPELLKEIPVNMSKKQSKKSKKQSKKLISGLDIDIDIENISEDIEKKDKEA